MSVESEWDAGPGTPRPYNMDARAEGYATSMIVIDDPWHDVPPHGPRATRVRRRALLWVRRIRFRRRARGLKRARLRRYTMRMARRKSMLKWLRGGRIYLPTRLHEIDTPRERHPHDDLVDAMGYAMLAMRWVP